MTFSIGCAVWAHKEWVGDFFPTGSRTADFLQLYSRRFTTVEGNTTFYSIPDQSTVARWVTETPPGFEFCLKLPRDLTHNGRLAPSIPKALEFVERMRGLGDRQTPPDQNRLGPFFAQLPPRYSPALLDDLATFLNAWSSERVPLALEVRHPDWFREPHASRLAALLKALGIGRVLLDSRPIYDEPDDLKLDYERRKPKLPIDFRVTAPFSLIRYISNPEQSTNQPFLEEWAIQIDQWLRQGIRIYFFVHCPIEARSPANARYFQNLLEQRGVLIPPLPWNTIDSNDSNDSSPSQLSLF